MNARVGLAVNHDSVRVVAVTEEGVLWAAEAAIGPDQALEAVIAPLLAQAPLRRWPRPTLSAAVGPHAAQLKRVAGLPEIEDPATLAAIIREGAGSFFLKNGAPLVITGVRPAGPGAAWAGAVDRHVVEAVRDCCRTRGWRLGLIAPVAVALPRAWEDPAFTWTDGRVVLEITRSNATLESVRTRLASATGQAASPLHPVGELAGLGDEAGRYADAYGAATLDAGEALAVDPGAAGCWSGARVRKALVAPGVVLVLAMLSLALSPLAARWAEKRAQAQADRVRGDQWVTIDSGLVQLHRVTLVLETMRAFAASRAGVTALLGDLTRALPEGSAIANFELDHDKAQVLVITPEPAAVLTAVKGLKGLAAAELAQTVTRGPSVGPAFQRVVLRFQLKASAGDVDSTGRR